MSSNKQEYICNNCGVKFSDKFQKRCSNLTPNNYFYDIHLLSLSYYN